MIPVRLFKKNLSLRYHIFVPLEMCNKTIIAFGFCGMQNDQSLDKSQLLTTLTLTLIILQPNPIIVYNQCTSYIYHYTTNLRIGVFVDNSFAHDLFCSVSVSARKITKFHTLHNFMHGKTSSLHGKCKTTEYRSFTQVCNVSPLS